MQELLVIIAISVSMGFLAYRIYKQWFTKKDSCGNCPMGKTSENIKIS